jgi:hypothetical protein
VNDQIIGVGPTTVLSLRVSVATLSRVVFPSPGDGIAMLALEHKATLVSGQGESQIDVKAQPFGGAIRILKIKNLLKLIGTLNFDSERSRSEQDFRVYIRPSDWDVVRDFCLRNLGLEDDLDLESDPSRELVEEFEDTLGIQLQPHQYSARPTRIIVEKEPSPTTNIHASSRPTVRVYQIYHVEFHDTALSRMMLSNSETHPGQVIQRQALEDARKGGKGRANAIFVAPLEQISAAYLAIPPELRGTPLSFGNTLLEGNVAAVLEDVFVPKYRQVSSRL